MMCLSHLCVSVNSLRRVIALQLRASTSYASVYYNVSFFFPGEVLLDNR